MKESVQLKQENLQLLSEEIVRPKYDRSRMKAGIVHIGVVGFIVRMKPTTRMS
jgi:mannitol 2-dehydrogenase